MFASGFLRKQTRGMCNRFQDGECHEPISNQNLIFGRYSSQSAKSDSPTVPPIGTSSSIFMTVRTQQVYFPTLLC